MVWTLLPVIGSTRRQYFVSGVPAGAVAVPAGTIGLKSGCAAGSGEAAMTMIKATITCLCAMSFLREWQRWHAPRVNISLSTDRTRGSFDELASQLLFARGGG